MENAADALIMAVDMLIFIVALTLCISSFSKVRQGVDNIINRPETIKMAKDSEGYINYIQSKKSKATRVVGIETLVPSLYRAIKENYVVYIKLNNPNLPSSINFVEAEKPIIIKNEVGTEDTIIRIHDKIYKFKVGFNQDINRELSKNNSILSNCGNLYYMLKDKTFYEYVGEYQLDNQTNSEDRITYRIITYVEKEP